MKSGNNFFRNLVVSATFVSFAVGALSLGGARAPWSTYDAGVLVGGVNQTAVYEVGVLRTRACFGGPCQTVDTPEMEDCDKAGKAAAAFVIMGLLACIISLLMVFFSSLRKGFLSMSFLTTAVFYAIAITTWAEGCHTDLEGRLNTNLINSGASVYGVTFEYGIGFGAILSAMTASLLSILFMCCTPDE